MKQAERSSGANGIWLCQSCSKLIDSDENRYTVTLLHQWKKDAVRRALDATASGRPLGALRPSPTADDADEQFLSGLGDLAATQLMRWVLACGRFRKPTSPLFGLREAGPRVRWRSRFGLRAASFPM